MEVAVLFSGGKDSVFAAFVCQSMGWDVHLLTVLPSKHSTMFHHPNLEWCKKQAEAMNLPITVVKAAGEEEKDELAAMKEALRNLKVDGVAAGAIESEYQKERVEKIAHELSIKSFCPIWRTGNSLLGEQCEYLETYIVSVAAEGLEESFLMKKFDREFVDRLSKLKVPINPHLEGGEGESFVTNAPFFSRPLKIKKWEMKKEGASATANITELS